MSPHLKAVLQALFVTFLWSTSWVLIKIGLQDIPPLTFAGLRYALAFCCLLPFALRRGGRESFSRLRGRDWLRLLALGVLMYTLTQGAQFFGLLYLPATTASLLLSFSPVAVAFLGMAFLAERPSRRQWVGVAFYLLGALIYFYPAALPDKELLGLAIVILGMLSNAGAAVLGRSVNRDVSLSPLTVTIVSMGVGSLLLLVLGLLAQGLPTLSLQSWLIVGWLAVVNTAFAFTLWNLTLRTLPAMDSSLINNTMLIQIAILAWVFLGERLGAREIIGLLLAVLGTLLVQLRGLRLSRKRLRRPLK
jgi:drug/metabolite transporter (DMT)-like permease